MASQCLPAEMTENRDGQSVLEEFYSAVTLHLINLIQVIRRMKPFVSNLKYVFYLMISFSHAVVEFQTNLWKISRVRYGPWILRL